MNEFQGDLPQRLVALESQTLDSLEIVLQQLDRALESLSYQDVELAGIVVSADDQVDERYVAVHHGILSLLADGPRTPAQARLMAALLYTLRCVERMGDQCVNIAKLVPLSGYETPKDKGILDAIERMGQLSRAQVLESREAFRSRNTERARDVVRQDTQINRLNRGIFRRAVEVGENVELREWAMFMVLVARCLERIGDNAVDIAEQVVFLITGFLREMPEFGAATTGQD